MLENNGLANRETVNKVRKIYIWEKFRRGWLSICEKMGGILNNLNTAFPPVNNKKFHLLGNVTDWKIDFRSLGNWAFWNQGPFTWEKSSHLSGCELRSHPPIRLFVSFILHLYEKGAILVRWDPTLREVSSHSSGMKSKWDLNTERWDEKLEGGIKSFVLRMHQYENNRKLNRSGR